MKNKKLFSLSVYREGLRRLLLPGGIFFIILTLEAVLIPMAGFISQITSNYSYASDYPSRIGASSVHPLLYAMIFIGAPILTWTMFSFLNKRSSSDFYHSLPMSRAGFYISSTAAVATWIVGLIFVTSGISRLMTLILNGVYEVIPCSYLPFMISCAIASLLVSAAMTIGMTVSGTVLGNIVVSGLVLFMPRYITAYIVKGGLSDLSVFSGTWAPRLLTTEINIVTGMFDFSAFTSAATQIYSLCLALVYFALAGILFYKRRSESAERTAPSKILQAVYRIAVAMVICVPVCCMIFRGYASPSEYFLYFIIYIAAIVVYFSFELITTRKLKNLVRALPGLGIVVLLNFIVIGAMWGLRTVYLNFTPDAGEVKSVTMLPVDEWDSEFSSLVYSKFNITDGNAIKIVTDALKAQSNAQTDRVWRYSYSSDGKINGKAVAFRINTGRDEKYRCVTLTEKEYGQIIAVLEGMEGYEEELRTLPSPDRGTLRSHSYRGLNYHTSYKDDETLFYIMQNELEEMSLDDLLTYMYMYPSDEYIAGKVFGIEYNGNDQGQDGRISYTTYVGGRKFEFSVSIYKKIMPESAKFINDHTSIIDKYNTYPIEIN